MFAEVLSTTHPQTGRGGCYLSSLLSFKGMALKSLRKTVLSCRRFISQGGREKSLQLQISKVNGLIKR